MIDELYHFFENTQVTILICLILAVFTGLILFLLFFKREDDKKRSTFAEKIHNFLTFKILMIDYILRILYTVCALFLSFLSLYLISVNIFLALFLLVAGNLIIRLIFEFLLLITSFFESRLPKKEDPLKEKKLNEEGITISTNEEK